jgi:single-strand DNA-binding protein
MNKVILIGNVGKDPETRQINDKNSVTSFSLATSETYKDKQGQKQTNTEWHNVKIWNKEPLVKYIEKGLKLMIEGKITYNSYEKDGKKMYFTDIVAQNVEFLSTKETRTDKKDNFDDVPDLNHDKSDLPF